MTTPVKSAQQFGSQTDQVWRQIKPGWSYQTADRAASVSAYVGLITSVSPIECSHPVRFIRCPAQPAPRLYFADSGMGDMFVSQCRGWRRRDTWVHGAQLTVTFDSSCAIWFFLYFGRTKSGDVEEDSQPPVVIIGAVTVWYTHKKAFGACFKSCWSRRNVRVGWWWFGRDTHQWQSGDGERCVARRPQAAPFHQECFAKLQGGDVPILYEAWLQETKKKGKIEPLTPECQTCQASEDTASSSLEEG